MIWTLGIDTASQELGIGLAGDGVPAAAFSSFARSSHAEMVADAVALLLQSRKIAPDAVTAIGVAAGPGSFTGLRIGISFVKGFCLDRTVRVLPVSSLESLARAWNLARAPSIVAAFDARNDHVVWNRFRCAGAAITAEGDDRYETRASFSAALAPGDTIVTDDVGNVRATPLPGHRAGDTPLQRGLACALAAAAEAPDSPRWTDARNLEPRYFAPAYADRAAGSPA